MRKPLFYHLIHSLVIFEYIHSLDSKALEVEFPLLVRGLPRVKIVQLALQIGAESGQVILLEGNLSRNS